MVSIPTFPSINSSRIVPGPVPGLKREIEAAISEQRLRLCDMAKERLGIMSWNASRRSGGPLDLLVEDRGPRGPATSAQSPNIP